MRSVLYKYQRRTVAAMVQRELDLSAVPNPLFVRLVGMKGEEFYFQPGSMELLMERPMVSPTRGGVLCEELGEYFAITAHVRHRLTLLSQ